MFAQCLYYLDIKLLWVPSTVLVWTTRMHGFNLIDFLYTIFKYITLCNFKWIWKQTSIFWHFDIHKLCEREKNSLHFYPHQHSSSLLAHVSIPTLHKIYLRLESLCFCYSGDPSTNPSRRKVKSLEERGYLPEEDG